MEGKIASAPRSAVGAIVATVKCLCALLRSYGPATLLATALLVPVPASGHALHTDYDLGKTTDWDSTGRTQEAEIPDVEGEGENTFRIDVQRPGPLTVSTSGGNLSPHIAIFEGTIRLTDWRTSGHHVTLDRAGIHYVRASSSSAGTYRLHVAGGGKGHDDIGNVIAEAAPIPQCQQLARTNPACKAPRPQGDHPWEPNEALDVVARVDYGRDRDWFTFDVPDGPPVPFGSGHPVAQTLGLSFTTRTQLN